MNKKTLILIIALVSICLMLFLILFMGKNDQKNPAPQNPAINQDRTNINDFPNALESASEDFTNPSIETKTAVDRSYAVSQLIPLLPYRSANFSLFYSFSDNKFTLYINSAAQTQGNADFDSFIRQNKVLDRSWVENLNTVVTPFTPGP